MTYDKENVAYLQRLIDGSRLRLDDLIEREHVANPSLTMLRSCLTKHIFTEREYLSELYRRLIDEVDRDRVDTERFRQRTHHSENKIPTKTIPKQMTVVRIPCAYRFVSYDEGPFHGEVIYSVCRVAVLPKANVKKLRILNLKLLRAL